MGPETTHIASARTVIAQADVYETPEPLLDNAYEYTYYFCCRTCGNCGRRHTGRAPAVEEAEQHVLNHPIQQETQNG